MTRVKNQVAFFEAEVDPLQVYELVVVTLLSPFSGLTHNVAENDGDTLPRGTTNSFPHDSYLVNSALPASATDSSADCSVAHKLSRVKV